MGRLRCAGQPPSWSWPPCSRSAARPPSPPLTSPATNSGRCAWRRPWPSTSGEPPATSRPPRCSGGCASCAPTASTRSTWRSATTWTRPTCRPRTQDGKRGWTASAARSSGSWPPRPASACPCRRSAAGRGGLRSPTATSGRSWSSLVGSYNTKVALQGTAQGGPPRPGAVHPAGAGSTTTSSRRTWSSTSPPSRGSWGPTGRSWTGGPTAGSSWASPSRSGSTAAATPRARSSSATRPSRPPTTSST